MIEKYYAIVDSENNEIKLNYLKKSDLINITEINKEAKKITWPDKFLSNEIYIEGRKIKNEPSKSYTINIGSLKTILYKDTYIIKHYDVLI